MVPGARPKLLCTSGDAGERAWQQAHLPATACDSFTRSVVKFHRQPFARKHTHIVSASSTRGWGAGLERRSECRAVRC